MPLGRIGWKPLPPLPCGNVPTFSASGASVEELAYNWVAMSEDLAARLERIERRLDALEARAPSVIRPPAPPVYYAAGPPPPPAPTQDLESLLGSRWLPRAGALAIVAALAYLVALGLQRGVITPLMVVVGIAVACFCTMGLGLRLKDEREAFGHVLVGLGTAGLYVDTVGAHFYQSLFSGPTMVGLCLAISLSALGYGFWRALPTFLGIGLSGGLLAALMPLNEGNTATAAGLLLLVTLPAFAVSAGRRWPVAVVGTWASSFAACIPILVAQGPVSVRLLPLDAVLLIGLAAWAVSSDRFPPTDPTGLFPPLAAVVTGALALAVFRGSDGAIHLFALGAMVAIIGTIFRVRETGRRILLSGAVLGSTVAPFGLSGHQIDLALVLVSLAGAGLASRYKSLAPLSVFQMVLALATFIGSSGSSTFRLTEWSEAGLIALLLSSAVANAAVLGLREGRVAAGLVVWGLTTRLALIGLDLPPNAAITLTWIAVCAGLFVVGFVRKHAELRQLGMAVAAVTVFKIVLVDLAELDSALKAAVLLILGLVLLAGGYAYVQRDRLKGNLGG